MLFKKLGIAAAENVFGNTSNRLRPWRRQDLPVTQAKHALPTRRNPQSFLEASVDVKVPPLPVLDADMSVTVV